MLRYCIRCRQNVTAQPEQDTCPLCGERLSEVAHEPTVDMQTGDGFRSIEPYEPSTTDPLVGQTIDRYRVERFLGRGGMARVYLAHHLDLERPCAIKLLREGSETGVEERVNAFLHEARAAASLIHPHVVTIHTLGHFEDQRFIEMEYVDGYSLAHHVRAAAPLDALEATRIMLQISSALAAAHQKQIVHRDIKPGNVMFTRSQQAKLADFGLAKRVRISHTAAANALCGTPHYMAPELFAGAPARENSDIYSMGVTYFNLLTGDLPIRMQSINDLIRLHATAEEGDWREKCHGLPQQVQAVLERCLAKDPLDRFHSGTELYEALRSTFGSLRSLKDLLNEALADRPFTREEGVDHFRVRVTLEGGRAQWVDVELSRGTESNEEIVRIYSLCGPTCTDYYEKALELNGRLPFGAIGIEPLGEGKVFVMANSYPRATCDPEELRFSILSIAAHADEVEDLLTGNDCH